MSTAYGPSDRARVHARALAALQSRLGAPPTPDEIRQLASGALPEADRVATLRRLAAFPESFAEYLAHSEGADDTANDDTHAPTPVEFPVWALAGFESSVHQHALARPALAASDAVHRQTDEVHELGEWVFLHRAEAGALFVRVERDGVAVPGVRVVLGQVGGGDRSVDFASAETDEAGEAVLRPRLGLPGGVRERAYLVRYPDLDLSTSAPTDGDA